MNSAHYAYVFAAALSLAGASSPAAVVPPALATAAGSAGEPSPEFRDLREQGIEFHNGAREGDEEAAEKAVERLERYVETFSNDGEARAYLGSACAMMARDASSVVNKMRYTNRGLRHLDRALEVGSSRFRRAPDSRQREFQLAEDVQSRRSGAPGHAGARRDFS